MGAALRQDIVAADRNWEVSGIIRFEARREPGISWSFGLQIESRKNTIMVGDSVFAVEF